MRHCCKTNFRPMNECLAGLWQPYERGYMPNFSKVCPALFTLPVLTDAASSEPAEGSTVCSFKQEKQASVCMLMTQQKLPS